MDVDGLHVAVLIFLLLCSQTALDGRIAQGGQSIHRGFSIGFFFWKLPGGLVVTGVNVRKHCLLRLIYPMRSAFGQP